MLYKITDRQVKAKTFYIIDRLFRVLERVVWSLVRLVQMLSTAIHHFFSGSENRENVSRRGEQKLK